MEDVVLWVILHQYKSILKELFSQNVRGGGGINQEEGFYHLVVAY